MSDDMQEGRKMSDTHENQTSDTHNDANLSRRKFAKAGLLGAPLIMTLNSRPVLGAYQCTVSGMMSGNLSNIDPNVDQCFSKSEGIWRGKAAMGKQADDGTYPDRYWPVPYYPEMRFHDVFNTSVYDYGNATFVQVMFSSESVENGGLNISNDHNVGFKAVGSLLNAKYFGKTYFGYDTDWVINTWNGWSGSVQDLAEFFSALNHRWDDDSPHPKHG